LRHAALLLLALAGCPLRPPPAQSRVQHGPAFGAQLVTVVALPAQPANCTPAECGAVATATRMALEFVGYTIIDAELLNAEMRRRTVKTHTSGSRAPHVAPRGFQPPSSDTTESTSVEGGVTFQQAPPQERGALVRDVGADGVLETAVVSTPGEHVWVTRYTVAVTLRTLDGRVVWHSDCSDDAGDLDTERHAIESATRCALESALLW
jgi:hypothetical protein